MNRILVIDDEQGIRAFLKVILEKEGYDVTLAECAEDVIQQENSDEVNVVISDINLPKANGIELLHHFQDHHPLVPFIVMTGDPTVMNTVQALRQGAFDYLVKPIDKNLLFNCVTKAIEMRALKLEKVRLEEANARHLQNLEKRVEERTQDLVKTMWERDLMQQSLIRQERLNALGTMSSIFAHDIRNLLTPISFHLESIKMKEQGLNEKSLQYLELIQTAVGDIESITKRIRDFSKGPDHTADEVEWVSPQVLVDRSVEMCWAKKEAHVRGKNLSVELTGHVDPDTPDIRVNSGEIVEALINLIFNAIDALPNGGIVELKVKADDQHVYFDVVDNGIGMDSFTNDRCIEPFYTTKGESGTGLGLSSVYGITDRNNGELTIDSTAGEGTLVRMAFSKEPSSKGYQTGV